MVSDALSFNFINFCNNYILKKHVTSEVKPSYVRLTVQQIEALFNSSNIINHLATALAIVAFPFITIPCIPCEANKLPLQIYRNLMIIETLADVQSNL